MIIGLRSVPIVLLETSCKALMRSFCSAYALYQHKLILVFLGVYISAEFAIAVWEYGHPGAHRKASVAWYQGSALKQRFLAALILPPGLDSIPAFHSTYVGIIAQFVFLYVVVAVCVEETADSL